jgi:heptosyltransferase-1
MSEILFIKTSSLGDVIHHLPALTEARRRLPAARFSWVVEEAFAPLVRLHPAVSEVIPVAARRWRAAAFAPSTWPEIANFLRTLRRRDYDGIVDTQGLFFKSAVVARLAHGERHGYDAGSIRERWASSLYDVRHAVAPDLHAITRATARLTALALGYQPDGALDFGLAREQLAGAASSPRHFVARRARRGRNGRGALGGARAAARPWCAPAAVGHRRRALAQHRIAAALRSCARAAAAALDEWRG